MLAQEEARRLGHNFVGTEQILLGLIGEGTGIAAKVLKSMGISLKDARLEVEKIIGRGSGFVAVEIPFTPRAKRVLELSLEEARQLGTIFICLQIQLICSCFILFWISCSKIITSCASSTLLDAPSL
jgi:ATP-dependent Clp protease ATP-binding subunit ClpC